MSENQTNQASVSTGPACEAEALIVEVLGAKHPDGQELRIVETETAQILTEQDSQRALETLDNSVLRVWPWCADAERDVVLEIAATEGQPLSIPLYSDVETTPREPIHQHYVLAPFVPLTLIAEEEPRPGLPSKHIVSSRAGYLYLFRNNRLWREIVVSQDESGRAQFHEIDLNDYRSDDGDQLTADRRAYRSVSLQEVWLPVTYSKTAVSFSSDVRLAWSEVQWSAARVYYLESDQSALRKRSQKVVQRPDARWNSGLAEMISLDEVSPQRAREPLAEHLVPYTYSYLTDLGGSYGKRSYDLAREEQQAFFEGGDTAKRALAETRYDRTQLGKTAAVRLGALQDLLHESQDEHNPNEAVCRVWDAIPKSEDVFAQARKRGVMGIVVYDALYEMRKALARTNSSIQYQQCVRLWVQSQPHFQSAELVEQAILPVKLGGQDNPLNEYAEEIDLSETGKLEKALRRAFRALAIETIGASQTHLLSLIKDEDNQFVLADLFSLEGGDYLSGFILSGNVFAALQHDAEAVDKPWLAETNPDCDTRCAAQLLTADTPTGKAGSQFIIDISRQASTQPIHGMLFPDASSVPLDATFEPGEPEANEGNGTFRSSAFSNLSDDGELPAKDQLQTFEAASLFALTEQGAYDGTGDTRNLVKALDGVSGLLVEQFQRAIKRTMAGTIRIQMDLHGPIARALKAMNPYSLGELQLRPYQGAPANTVAFAIEDPAIGLRNGLTEAERDYFNTENRSGRFMGELTDAEGRVIGGTNPRRLPAGKAAEYGEFVLFMAPSDSDFIRNYREVRQEISQKRSLGKSLDNIGLPYVVLAFEFWNISSEAARFSGLWQRGRIVRAFAGTVSAAGDLAFASMAVAEQLSKKVLSSEIITSALDRVLFKVSTPATSNRLLTTLLMSLPQAVTVRLIATTGLSVIYAGIQISDSYHYFGTGQTASGVAMGVGAAGTLMSAWGMASLIGEISAAGSAAVLGLSNPAGWVVLGIGFTLSVGGSLVASWLEDDQLELWLNNGPFGEYRDESFEHLWGTQSAAEDEKGELATDSWWSSLPFFGSDNDSGKPVDSEGEAFYRLANILAGVRVEQSLHHVGTGEALRIAEERLKEQGKETSRRDIDVVRQRLETVNFRLVVRSNLMQVLDETNLHVSIRRLRQQHRPNPAAGGTTIQKTDVQKSPGDHWWIYRRPLPDGVEYWLHTPPTRSLEVYEWALRARIVASLGTDDDYVFPSPPVDSSLVFDPESHGRADNPDFESDDAPFWLSFTSDRRQLSFEAIRDAHREQEGVKLDG